MEIWDGWFLCLDLASSYRVSKEEINEHLAEMMQKNPEIACAENQHSAENWNYEEKCQNCMSWKCASVWESVQKSANFHLAEMMQKSPEIACAENWNYAEKCLNCMSWKCGRVLERYYWKLQQYALNTQNNIFKITQ